MSKLPQIETPLLDLLLRTNSGVEVDGVTCATEIRPEMIEIEDGGCAMIIELDTKLGDHWPFVRLQSWDDKAQHKILRSFIGKRVEVTIKVVG